jgi:hypothetical protein
MLLFTRYLFNYAEKVTCEEIEVDGNLEAKNLIGISDSRLELRKKNMIYAKHHQTLPQYLTRGKELQSF